MVDTPTQRRLALGLALAALGLVRGLAAIDFARDIQPLLAENCYKCHGPSRSENGLRLDLKSEALKGGDHGPALVPGRAADSLLVKVINGTHSELPRMPRKGPALTPAAVALVAAWIEQGAAWPETLDARARAAVTHWAFQPITHPEPPKVGRKLRSAVRDPIDQFVLAKLEAEKLTPSPEADPTTLIRRVSLDLTGLPPTPGEVDAFVADKSKDAFAKLVERLLKSPHYGEKWGRHWLDAARYADSNGFEKDRTRSIWPWRDWVIRSFNDDKPFDQFTREQLAGDILAGASAGPAADDLRVATGFLRNSMVNMEGGIEPEKFRVESIIDRVDAVGRTWLGLTIACAQCHNHKFDPISQKEYYQFYDFLNQDVEPKLDVPQPDTRQKRETMIASAKALEEKLMSDPAIIEKYSAWEKTLAPAAVRWTPIDVREWHSSPMKYEKQEDLSFLGGGDVYNSGVIRLWADLPQTNLTGFRFEALNHGNLPFSGPGLDGNGDFLIDEFTVEQTPLKELAVPNAGATNFTATTNRVKFARAVADVEAPGLPARLMIDGIITNGGWGPGFTKGRRNQERRAVFEAERPFGFPGGARFLITLHSKPGEGLNNNSDKVSSFIPGRFRLSATTDAGPLAADPLSEKQRAILAIPAVDRSPEQRRELFRVFLFQDSSLADSARQWDALWQDWPGSEATTLVLQRRDTRRDTRIFHRGDWQKPTASVGAEVPSALPPFPRGAPRNRLGLAQWLVGTNNPLTARVIVNRVWLQYFGVGLVSTPEDFGTRADPPSHPELLDWLASEFMRRGWRLKELHRLIALSGTYRQASRVSPEMLERDPYNRLLARGPRVRVDAEEVQDIALAASGLLSPKIGGPSVFPPLPDGVMSLAYNQIPWNVSEGDDRYRRAMYTFWKRSVPYPVSTAFDAPTGDQSCVRRNRSNTPLQALTTLNEPTFNQAARWLAWRALQFGGVSDPDRAIWAFRQCLGRRPDAAELGILLRLHREAATEFSGRIKDASLFALADPKNPPPLPPGVTTPDLAAWSAVTRAILNLDETITKE